MSPRGMSTGAAAPGAGALLLALGAAPAIMLRNRVQRQPTNPLNSATSAALATAVRSAFMCSAIAAAILGVDAAQVCTRGEPGGLLAMGAESDDARPLQPVPFSRI